MLVFKSLHLENFLSFKECDIEFIPGKHIILGKNTSSQDSTSNGSGKSALIEAIVWAIYNKSARDNNVSRDGKGDCKVSLSFYINTNLYRIDRYCGHHQEGNSVKLFCDNEEVTPRKGLNTDKEILKLINLSYDIFIYMIILMQGLPINFCSLTPTLRKNLFEELTGFTEWDNLKSRFSNRKTSLLRDKSNLELDYNIKKDNMIALNSSLKVHKEMSERSIDEANVNLLKIKDSLDRLTVEVKRYSDKKLEVLSGITEKDLSDKISVLNKSVGEFTTSIYNINSIINDKICPLCGSEYPEEKIKRCLDEKKILEDKLSRIQTALNNLKNIESTVNIINSKISAINSDIIGLKGQESQVISAMQKTDSNTIKLMEDELSLIHKEVTDLYNTLNSLDTEISQAVYIESLLLPSSKFRTQILSKYLVHINNIIELISPLLFNNIKVMLGLDKQEKGIEIFIEKNGINKSYKSFSGGEKRRLDIIIILAFQRFLIESTGIATNLYIFDEVFDNLDSRGMEAVVSSIDSLFPDNSTVYIVSHNNTLKSLFDKSITVIKENEISKLFIEED